MKNPSLYIVATPIGSKADISQRALEVLNSVDIIACEDSRVSKKLLESNGIASKLLSYHKFNEKQRTSEFLKLIEEGKKIALISDAGTPCISDPGRILVKELFEKGIEITSVPGATAITVFASQIPREREDFAFFGFLPRIKSQQIQVFEKFAHTDLIFYESANRLIETLENIKESRGVNARAAIGRELTKMYEETVCGSVQEIIEHYKTAPLKGEIAVMLYAQETGETGEEEILEKIKKLKAMNLSDKDISSVLSTLFGWNKNRIYKLSLKIS